MTGFIYFIVIIIANTLGAVSGMGGGVLIKPVLDLVGAHSVAAISFYSATAVLTMSLVSTVRQLKSGQKLEWQVVMGVSIGANVGGFIGNTVFDFLLNVFKNDDMVQMIQIILTIVTLLFAFFYTRYQWRGFHLKHVLWYLLCGLILGFLASLLGIGGGPINVSLLMLLFGIPIKEATVYSICTIFFSQLAKIGSMAIGTGFNQFDLSMLGFIIPAAIIGGFSGAKASQLLSPERVTVVFQFVIFLVLLINIYNGFQLL